MSNSHETFDTIVGVAGLLTIPSVIAAIIYNLLPSTRLRDLEQLFSETEGLLQKGAEDGLLVSHEIASGFQSRLDRLRERIREVQVESHSATTYGQNLKKLLCGLSRRISSLCDQVKELRADISTTSARERERLRQSQSSAACATDADQQATSESGHKEQPNGNPATEGGPPSCAPPHEHGSTADRNLTLPIPVKHPLVETNVVVAAFPTVAFFPTPSTSTDCNGTLGSQCNYAPESASSVRPIAPATPVAGHTCTPSEERGDSTASPADIAADRASLHTHSRSSVSRHKRYGSGKSGIRGIARLLRGEYYRRRSSSNFTHGLLLVPSQTLASIELASGGDDPEWEDIAVRKVLPV